MTLRRYANGRRQLTECPACGADLTKDSLTGNHLAACEEFRRNVEERFGWDLPEKTATF